MVVVSLWRTTTTTTSSRPQFGGHDLQTMEIIRSVSSFEKNPYNVSSNLSLSRAHFMFMWFLGSSWRSWRSFQYLYSTFLCIYYIYKVKQKSSSCQRLNSSSTERWTPVREVLVGISLPPMPLSRKYAQICKFFFIN